MIHIINHKQQQIFDPWGTMSPKRRQLLQESWPGLFKDEILPHLPVETFKTFFNKGFGRPTKELYTVLSVLILQETLDLTDRETVEQLSFNIQWHYALNITDESDEAKYLCLKTLWNMRTLVIENNLDEVLFNICTDKLAKTFNVNPDKQRLDSVHIKSNMRRLGRINIFSTGIHNFLVNLKRNHLPLFETIDTAVIERYLSEKSLNCFSMIKPSEAPKTLEIVSNDLFHLTEQFKDHPDVIPMKTYQMLKRILNDQCNLSTSENGPRVTVKDPKDVASDSLQNPSDPDASYSGHKGQGYQVQVMETYTTDAENKDKILNLITHVEVERAHESDVNALIPAIESTQERNLGPKEALVDSLYGSDENVEEARLRGVEVVSPTMGTVKTEGLTLNDFITDKDGNVVSCPGGHSPLSASTNEDRHVAVFDIDRCNACQHRKTCPIESGKRGNYLRYTDKQLRLAQRREHELTDEFKDRYRWRSGVEATMSEFDRRTGVKHLRVRGLKRVRYCATLKALGINLLRTVAVMIVLNKDKQDENTRNSKRRTVFVIFKDLFMEYFLRTITFLNRLLFRKYFSCPV